MLCSDRDLLRLFRAERNEEAFQPFLRRYLGFVYSSALRQVGNEGEAAEVTRAVFLAFANRARRLPRKTVLAAWFFRATRYGTARVLRNRKRVQQSVVLSAGEIGTPDQDELWRQTAPCLDKALDRLSVKHRLAVLVRWVLGWSVDDCAVALRIRPSRADKRAAKGLRQLAVQLQKRGVQIDGQSLRTLLANHGCREPVPENFSADILAAAGPCFRRKPQLALAATILRAFTWAAWKQRVKFAATTAASLTGVVAILAVTAVVLWNNGQLLPWILEIGARLQVRQVPELAQPAKPWPTAIGRTLPWAAAVHSAAEFYQTTNVWTLHLAFAPDQWSALKPAHVPPVPKLIQPDGTVVLRNPKAQRNGVAGALGFDYNWVHAGLELSGAVFTNVAVRLRGNGTFLSSFYGLKRPYKIDLNKFEKQPQFAGIGTLDLLNAIEDRSYMSDALGYELFRDAQVPAPRTAYAWLTLSVPALFNHKPLGLYVLVENVDANFAAEHFGSRKAPIFKPVTPELFKDLGNDWADYAGIYDLKTKATAEQKRRVIDFARLVTYADDAGFERYVSEFLDLEEFARFLAALVLVGNYDSILTYGQNYYMYLDPRSARFGFIPWDLDQAWGSFTQFASASQRERASIWHPWVGRNRFLERVMAVELFKRLYRARLEDLLRDIFIPERLNGRIDQLAPVIRDAIGAESGFRLRLFEQAISTNWLSGPRDGGEGPKRPVHQLKRYIVNRAQSVRDQLDGRADGVILRGLGK